MCLPLSDLGRLAKTMSFFVKHSSASLYDYHEAGTESKGKDRAVFFGKVVEKAVRWWFYEMKMADNWHCRWAWG